MNVNGLSMLVRAEVVREVPKLEDKTDTFCEACSKEKQVKVQHKKLPEIGLKKILELIRMDLMKPIQTESMAGK